MTMILALRCDGGVVIAADSLEASGDFRVADVNKLRRTRKWVWGASGSVTFITQLAAHMDAASDSDLLSPLWNMGRVARLEETLNTLRDQGNQHLDRRESPNLILTDGREIWCINQDGYAWPSQQWQVIGPGESIAYYLLRKHYRPGLTPEEACALAQMVITEVASVSVYVATPATAEFVPWPQAGA